MGNHVIERTWERMLEPVCIFGNLYFVGTIPASTHILKTKDGLIMFDSGYQETLYMVIDNMYRLGLNPHDIKMIIHTHGHVDHFGATAALQKMTGAKAGIAELDKTYVTGEENLSWADELDLTLIPFTPDFIYTDGDVLSFGGVDIKCIATPGHTPGTTSFVFDVTDGEKTLTACLLGGVGFNSMQKSFLKKYNLSEDTRNAFPDSMDRFGAIEADIFLGNHAVNNNTPEKIERVLNGEKDAFICKGENKEFAEHTKQRYLDMIKGENL